MSRKPPNDELFARVEQARRDEWDAMQPELEKFRTTPEEVRAKAEENAVAFMKIEDGRWAFVDKADDFHLWAECIGRMAREIVRFDRWRYPHIYSNNLRNT